MSTRVLLVDDVAARRRLVGSALRRRGAGAVVGEAVDAATAVALAGQLYPDVVVIDLGLLELAGQDVLTCIRASTPTAQVVVLSGGRPDELGEVDPDSAGARVGYLVGLLVHARRRRPDVRPVHLAGVVASAREARTFTRRVLAEWDLQRLADDAALVASEMVTNAVRHARSDCQLRISRSDHAVRVEVEDRGAGTPDPLPPSPSRDSGRGLHLIDGVAAAWGVDPEDGGGKTVWVELLRDASWGGS